jgi:hypothetical protein
MSSSFFNSSSKPLTVDGSETDHPLVEGTIARYSNLTDPPNELLARRERREKECLQQTVSVGLGVESAHQVVFHLDYDLVGVGFCAEGKYNTVMDGLAYYAAFNAAVHRSCNAMNSRTSAVQNSGIQGHHAS